MMLRLGIATFRARRCLATGTWAGRTWTAATTAAIERVAAKEPEPDARRLFGHKLTETGAWTAHPHVAEGAQAPGDKVVTVRVGCLSPAQVVFPFHTMCTGAEALRARELDEHVRRVKEVKREKVHRERGGGGW